MRIAVPCEDGYVNPHFGHAEAFKVYDIENGQITGSKLIEARVHGHDARAKFLSDAGITTLVCGNIGSGSADALTALGIEICSGAQGDPDRAATAFLAGELVSAGVNGGGCSHHDENSDGCCCGHDDNEDDCGCGCGDDSEGCCGGGCGDDSEGCGCSGGCGGCGGPRPVILEGKNAGKTVKTHYRGTFDDGSQFDASYDRGEPLEFVCGTGMMIPGYDKAVVDMEVGQTINIHLTAEEAYGPKDPAQIYTFKIAELPGSDALEIGQRVYLSDAYGRQVPVTVLGKDAESIVLDANHEMAGKELNFEITLVSAE